ncbi:MAG: Qat anti-phage system ATPase QatA [Pseudomonadota bacterium]
MTIIGPSGFLFDQETKVDFLNNEAMARSVVSVIKKTQGKPITIGVHGDWGAGKSSVLEMIEEGLSAEKEILCIKFNGWQFQGFEDAKIAVIESIVTELIAKRSLMTIASEEVKNLFHQIDWLKVAKKAGGLAFTAFTGIPTLDQIGDLLSAAKSQLGNPSELATEDNIKAVASATSSLLKDKSENHNIPKEINEFKKAFDALLKKAKIDRLVVLIDDLDRCLPQTAVETLEAIRLFVSLPKTAFVIGADEAMIEYSVKHHFPDLPESTNAIGYARNYLEKLIQVPMRIPALGETETSIYVELLLMGAELGEDSEEFGKLLELGRKALKKPWSGDGIDRQDVKNILGEKFDQVLPSLSISDQIAPILSSGTKGNPRQIKRFLNALNLRLQVARERGFGDEIKSPYLAKLMLAEMFLDAGVFEHMARSAANAGDGVCREINILENQSKAKKNPTDKKANEEATAPEENSVVKDWETRPEVLKWIEIEPKFNLTSLKPYLFVIKDRKNYLDVSSHLSPKLIELVTKLVGGKANSSQCSKDLKALTIADADLIFKELQRKLNSCTSFETKPPVMFGINELVKSQSGLQTRYLDLLDNLPVNKLGPWAASGHDAIVTDSSAKTRLETIMNKFRLKGTAGLKSAFQITTNKE